MTRFNPVFGWCAGIAVLVSTCAAYAASPAIIAAITARKANYKEIGGDFKAISDEIKAGAPILPPSVRKRATWQHVPPGSRDIFRQAAIWGRA